MNEALVSQIADAVLYEGYILYPYRPSVKNRHRWTFGGLVPRAYRETHTGSDPWQMRIECVICGHEHTNLQAAVRFLHLQARLVWELETPQAEVGETDEPACRFVESLRVGDQMLQSWQEASERTFAAPTCTLGTLVAQPRRVEFTFPANRQRELVREPAGNVVGFVERTQNALSGVLELSALEAAPGIFKVRASIENQTRLEQAAMARDDAMMWSLASTHMILSASDGGFVSLADPPPELNSIAKECENVGAWPVLIGNPGDTDTILAAPIILYDYPQIADESPGDLFDGLEIDEILTLRILTLTDDEKQQAAAVDDRVRALLQRTEMLAPNQRRGMHGAMRGMHELTEE